MMFYLVSGGSHSNEHWFCAMKVPRQWMNFIVAKKWQHALAQFRRLPVRHRQIDVVDGGRKHCILYGKFRRQK